MNNKKVETQDLLDLPELAQIAFGARCIRRVYPILKISCPYAPSIFLKDIDEFIKNAEDYAETGEYQFYKPKCPSDKECWVSMKIGDFPAMEHYGEKGQGLTIDFHRQRIGDNIWNAAIAIRGAAHYRANNEANWIGFVIESVALAYGAFKQALATGTISTDVEEFESYLSRDLRLLQNAIKQNNWENNSPIGSNFFSLHSEFETERLIEGKTIIDISGYLTAEIVKYFKHSPWKLYELTPRQFEEFIANLFSDFGYRVDLTAATRDKGRDVIAVKHEVSKLQYLIECKRYQPSNKVGIAAVQRLQGITLAEGANKGILVTTSSFTDPALEAIKKTPWLLEGRDFIGILEWLHEYEIEQINKLIKPI